MIFKRVYLEENNQNVYLDVYVADPIKFFTRKGILVIWLVRWVLCGIKKKYMRLSICLLDTISL